MLPQIHSDLDAPITESQVKGAINSLSDGKSPELDGLPVEYYKAFVEILAPILTKVFMEALEDNSLPLSFTEAFTQA